MLSTDQIRSVAEEIRRSADQRLQDERAREVDQLLWESVRHACHIVEAVAALEADGEATRADRLRGVNYVMAELETGMEVARRARKAAQWGEREPEQ